MSATASSEPKEAQQEWPSTPLAEAERMVEKAQTRNMTVKFMMDKLKEVRLHAGRQCMTNHHASGGRRLPCHAAIVTDAHPPSPMSSHTAASRPRLLLHAAGGLRGGAGLLPGGALRCTGGGRIPAA